MVFHADKIEKVKEVAEMLAHASTDQALTANTLRYLIHDAARALRDLYDPNCHSGNHTPSCMRAAADPKYNWHGCLTTIGHNTESANCWCNPEVETDPVTGNKVIIHKDIVV